MAEQYGGAERRRFERLKVDFSVRYQIRRPPEVVMTIGGQKIEAIMLDLGEEGMAIKTAFDMPPGTVLLMNFVLVYAYERYENIMQDMSIEGTIVNKAELAEKTFRLGIHFSKITSEDRKVLIDFVKSSSKKSR